MAPPGRHGASVQNPSRSWQCQKGVLDPNDDKKYKNGKSTQHSKTKSENLTEAKFFLCTCSRWLEQDTPRDKNV
jgi:hypothetical protein